MLGWIKIKDTHINLDTVSAIRITEDAINMWANGKPLANFQCGIGPSPETVGGDELDMAKSDILDRMDRHRAEGVKL